MPDDDVATLADADNEEAASDAREQAAAAMAEQHANEAHDRKREDGQQAWGWRRR